MRTTLMLWMLVAGCHRDDGAGERRTTAIQPPTVAPPTTSRAGSSEVLARGEYLVRHVADCLGCHGNRDWTRWGAPLVDTATEHDAFCFDKDSGPALPPAFAHVKICAPNISSDAATGLGAWTDEQIAQAITQGITRDGRTMTALMPSAWFRDLPASDVDAIVAYVRTLPAKHASAASEARIGADVLPRSERTCETAVPIHDRPELAAGKLLSDVGGCVFCHTKLGDPAAVCGMGGSLWRGRFGSETPPDIRPRVRGWSEAAFIEKMQHPHVYPEACDPCEGTCNGHPCNTIAPVLAFSKMSVSDLKLLYAYLAELK